MGKDVIIACDFAEKRKCWISFPHLRTESLLLKSVWNSFMPKARISFASLNGADTRFSLILNFTIFQTPSKNNACSVRP